MTDTRIDVLIVGGGIAGCATAYYLARLGVGALVLERLDLATQASGSNAGSLHAQIPHVTFVEEGEAWARQFAPTLRLMRRSIGVWQGLETELAAELDVAVTGGLLVASSEAQMRDIARKAVIEREQGLEIELLSATDIRSLAPYLASEMVGGAFCPTEGKANPLRAAFAFASAAERHGATIRRGSELLGLEADGSGYRAATSDGTIHAARVVDCAGASAGQIAAMLGVALAVEQHPIQVNVTEPVEPFMQHLLYYAGGMLTLKQARNGSLLIGGGWPARMSAATGLPAVDGASLGRNLAIAQAVVPRIGAARLVRAWAAIVNGTADWNPILGELPGRSGFFVNFFPWMGFTAAPLCAQITADLVAGRSIDPDLREHTLSR